MLNWLSRFNIFCFLDNNNYQQHNAEKEVIAAAGVRSDVHCSYENAFASIESFLNANTDWAFGHLGYDLKNAVENLQSNNSDYIKFPDLYFFCPEVVVTLNEQQLTIGVHNGDHQKIYNQIIAESSAIPSTSLTVEINTRFTREEYIQSVLQIQNHIQKGDCYEVNFCQEFFAEGTLIQPTQVFHQLNQFSPNPFAAFYRLNGLFCMSASPERFLKKTGSNIISQPIKGTAPRNSIIEVDLTNLKELQSNSKEISENVMVVDLVRNDLSKLCEMGSVTVEELCKIYSFPHVHQMISTISGELRNNVSFSEILQACFPMGSMTGAPKKRVMELIEQYEKTKRGLFSGSIGYIDPQRNFDFNVIIRSLMYNATDQYLSYQTGSAITIQSDAAKEYDECMLKGEAIRKVLNTA